MTHASLPTPVRYEPLTPEIVKMLLRSMSPIQAMVLEIGNADPAKGVGVIEDATGHSKCLWTKNGKRITVSVDSGTLCATLSKETDPLSDPAAR